MSKHFLLTKRIFNAWQQHNVSSMAAAVSYFAIFALIPLLVICISVVGIIFGNVVAEKNLIVSLTNLIGKDSAEQIRVMLAFANRPTSNLLMSIFGTFIVIFSASGLFIQLQNGLNDIYNTTRITKTIVRIILNYSIAVLLTLSIGLFLILTTVINSMLTIIDTYLLDGYQFLLWTSLTINFIASLAITIFLFAAIYKILPETTLSWGDVFPGALLAALLFTLAKSVLGFYIGISNVASVYGAAGAFVIILIWIYYSAQVFFIGALYNKARKAT